MTPIQHSFKTRILFVTGSVLILIMMLISITILFQWRTILIKKEIHNAQSVANAFVVPALDAMIYAEQRELLKGDLLETYIDNFMQKVTDIKYIQIFDENYNVIAEKDVVFKKNQKSFGKIENIKSDNIQSKIYKSKEYNWVLETYTPLVIGDKRWGITKIGFDAKPVRNEIKEIFFALLGLTVIISLVTLSVLYLLVNKITYSLNNLVKQIDKIDFNTNERIHLIESKDEIGFMFERFDDLLKRLYKSKDQLSIAQKQVYQSEKLASIGRLASGIAHEINNPLNGIKSCIYAIQNNQTNNDQINEYLSLINEGVTYIDNVIKKLLGFVRQQPQKINLHSLNELIFNVYRLLEYKLKQKNADVQLKLSEDIPLIKVDSQLIQEVIMNLLINSYDAIHQNGKIVISSGYDSDNTVFFSITDNGPGIAQTEIEKLFDPFYTTKDPGKGTGLGLWVSLNIIENHNGKILVRSIPNTETIFTVILPTEVSDENIIS
ncbi:MAG: ATP-binding protein [Ignavibacterium sp.]|nr:ATP-binding protein [Ignavibacterium sp.]